MNHLFQRKLRPGTIANAVSMTGYAAALGWLIGGPTALAWYSILADELDGKIARFMGEPTDYGSELDYAVDVTLTGALALRMGAPWLLLAVTPAQAYFRYKGDRPVFGSFRAALMSVALFLKK